MSKVHAMLDRALRSIERDLRKLDDELGAEQVSDDSRKALDRYTRTLLSASKQTLVEEQAAREDLSNVSDEELKKMLAKLEGNTDDV